MPKFSLWLFAMRAMCDFKCSKVGLTLMLQSFGAALIKRMGMGNGAPSMVINNLYSCTHNNQVRKVISAHKTVSVSISALQAQLWSHKHKVEAGTVADVSPPILISH